MWMPIFYTCLLDDRIHRTVGISPNTRLHAIAIFVLLWYRIGHHLWCLASALNCIGLAVV